MKPRDGLSRTSTRLDQIGVHPTEHRFQHRPKGLTSLGQRVFNPCRHFGVDFSADEALLPEVFQTPTKGGGGDTELAFEFVKPHGFIDGAEEMKQVQDVGFPEEINEGSALRLKTNGFLFEGLAGGGGLGWLHDCTNLPKYIKNVVPKGKPRFGM